MKKRILTILLAFTMMLSAIGPNSQAKSNNVVKAEAIVSSTDDDAPVAESVEATEKFLEALSKVCEGAEASGNFAKIVMSGGGLTAAVSGCVAILKIVGVIEDPTEKALTNIMNGIKDVEETLHNMSKDLNKMADQLIGIAATQKEQERLSQAISATNDYNSFYSDYIKPLTVISSEYDEIVNNANKSWWKETTHNPIAVAYKKEADGSLTQVYVRVKPGESMPAKAENGATIDQDSSFIIPSEMVPATADIDWNVNKYADTFKGIAKDKILNGLARVHDFVTTRGFRGAWCSLTDAERQEKSAQYAADALGAALYQANCNEMTKEYKWVGNLTGNFTELCNRVLNPDTGIYDLINSQFNTHIFEGEVRENIDKICDCMIATVGLYGQLALNCAGQDDDMMFTKKQALQSTWIKTINKIDSLRKTSLHGYDNYCYLINGLVNHKSATLSCENTMEWTFKHVDFLGTKIYQRRLDKCTCKDWKVTGENGKELNLDKENKIDDKNAQVILDHYKHSYADKMTFAQFLAKNYVGTPEKFNGTITTTFNGADTFALSDNVEMTTLGVVQGDFFKVGNTYTLPKGESAEIKDEYFVKHDMVTHTCLDTKSGSVKSKEMIAARAAYAHHDWTWETDEMYFFSANADTHKAETFTKKSGETHYTTTHTLTAPIAYLSISAAK